MLNSKHLSLVNKIGDKTEFTITRVHCTTVEKIPPIPKCPAGPATLGRGRESKKSRNCVEMRDQRALMMSRLVSLLEFSPKVSMNFIHFIMKFILTSGNLTRGDLFPIKYLLLLLDAQLCTNQGRWNRGEGGDTFRLGAWGDSSSRFRYICSNITTRV